jgi:hypothetical protein
LKLNLFRNFSSYIVPLINLKIKTKDLLHWSQNKNRIRINEVKYLKNTHNTHCLTVWLCFNFLTDLFVVFLFLCKNLINSKRRKCQLLLFFSLCFSYEFLIKSKFFFFKYEIIILNFFFLYCKVSQMKGRLRKWCLLLFFWQPSESKKSLIFFNYLWLLN